MEALNQLFDLGYELGMGVITSMLMYSFAFGLFGLATAIMMVRLISKKKGFDRPFALWSFVAKLNKLYLPLLAMVGLAAIGAVYGINDFINGQVEAAVYNSVDQVNAIAQQDGMAVFLAKHGGAYAATGYVDGLFAAAYSAVFFTCFITFLQLPFYEFIAYGVYRLLFGSPAQYTQVQLDSPLA